MFRPVILAIVLSCAVLPAQAQSVAFGGIRAATTAEVEISADSLSVNQADGSALFQGNVVIGQGDMRLSAQTVRVEYASGTGNAMQRRIQALEASGGVTLVSGPDAAEAESARYEVDSGLVTLTGGVMLTQGTNVLSGERVVVNLTDGTARAEGRVRTVLQPGGN